MDKKLCFSKWLDQHPDYNRATHRTDFMKMLKQYDRYLNDAGQLQKRLRAFAGAHRATSPIQAMEVLFYLLEQTK